MISKSSASSRAIPSAKMIERIEKDTALPVYFGSNQPGMQAGAELTGEERELAQVNWQLAAFDAIKWAKQLQELGLHKQVANRVLEPFNWHTAILTATELDNFFWQRCDKAAQPEFKALADAMQHAYYMGDPLHISEGIWHVPFADDDETVIELSQFYRQSDLHTNQSEADFIKEMQKQLSAARCARVSYLHHDGTRAVGKDFDLYDKLTTGMHPSPAEHQGTPCTHLDTINFIKDGLYLVPEDTSTIKVSCNLQGTFSTGWHQLRKFWKNENRLNFIPNLPELAHIADKIKAGEKLW
jgi:hypothetical protein